MDGIFSARAWLAALMLTVVGITAAVGCSSQVEVQDREIEIAISDGKINIDPPLIQVNQGDSVTLQISSDDDGLFHLHGYDIEKDVGPGTVTPLEFAADATGRFNFTFHAGTAENGHGHDAEGADSHGALFESETLHANDSFSFSVPHDRHDEMILYHNHMAHAMTGTVIVDHDSSEEGTVEIQIGEDGSFSPAKVTVAPGATLKWVNVGSERQRVTSGMPPMSDEPDDSGEDSHEHEGGENGEENEINLGTLEVRPR